VRRFPSRRPASTRFAPAPLALALTALLALVGLASTPRAVLAEEDAPEPPPPPLVTRSYDIAWATTYDPSPEALFPCDPESGLRPAPLRVARRPGDESDALGAILDLGDPSGLPRSTGCGDRLSDLVERALSSADHRGTIDFMGGILFVRKPAEVHARFSSYLAELEAAFARRAAVSVRLVALPVGDPVLLAAPPEALVEAAVARGRVLCAGRRSLELPAWGARMQASVRRTTSSGLRAGRSGAIVVAEVIAESLPSGVDIDVGVFASTESGRLRMRIRAAEVSVDGVARRRALGADIDLPARAERSALSVVEVADGGRAAIVVGPRGVSETAVLVVEAKAVPPALEGAHEPGRHPSDWAVGKVFEILDAAAATSSTGEGDFTLSPDVLIEILKGATGGDEAWGDGTSVDWYRGQIMMTNTPAVISQSAAIIRDLGERNRPRRCDAWLLEARSLGSLATGAIDAASAEALLARAAKRDGVTLAARFGGGLAARGALFARSRTETRFLGGVDAISLGTPSATATLRVPITAAVDAGIAFEARLGRTGLDAASGAASRLVLEAKVTLQTVDLSRTARVPLEGGEAIDVALPVVAREEVAGRVELPFSGGWALVVSEGPADDPARPHRLLLLRVGP